MSKKESNDNLTQVCMRLPVGMHTMISYLAESEGISKPQLVEGVITEKLKDELRSIGRSALLERLAQKHEEEITFWESTFNELDGTETASLSFDTDSSEELTKPQGLSISPRQRGL